MFDSVTFLLTAEKVTFLLLFIGAGYGLRKSGKLKESAITPISVLLTSLFAPCYTFRSLSKNFVPEKLWHNLSLILVALAIVLVTYPLAKVIGNKLGKTEFEKSSLTYIYTFPNSGYFGYPVIENVFGQTMLANFIVFCLPFSIANYSYGNAIFAGKDASGGRWKKALISPMMFGCYLGIFFGICGFRLPTLLASAVDASANCMSPVSMLLAGLALGAFPFKKLLAGWRALFFVLLRLVGLFALFGAFFYLVSRLLGLPSFVYYMPMMYLCLPVGLNCVVFPQSFGHDASDNARLCFLSFLLSLLTLPVIFSFLQTIF